MPINRVPVVHKFGIISQTQRVELERRIAKKALIESRLQREAQCPPELTALPFEVTEDFVYRFNDCSHEEKEMLEDDAFKMLKRLKRLAGLRQAGEAYHVDLARAWVDLALLAQCRSARLQEACLEALITSLNQAPLHEEQILSLFYLAKSGVHWLKKEERNSQTVLRSSEILLLKMTYLAFIRLYCHQLLDQLKGYEDQKKSLEQYLKTFPEKARSYDQFPGAHLSARLISEAGRSLKHSPSAEVHNSIFLQCCLNVWYAVHHSIGSVGDLLCDLLESAAHLFIEDEWLELVLAFNILADASCESAHVFEAFQFLMSIQFSPAVKQVNRASRLCETCYSSLPTSRDNRRSSSVSFRDSLPKNESERGTEANLMESLQRSLEDDECADTEDPANSTSQPLRASQDDHICTEYYSGPRRAPQKLKHRWPWELTNILCECLTTVCLHGACADVQKFSLLGMSENACRKYGLKPKTGLVEFLQYDDSEESWKVRYGAVKSLERIYRHFKDDVTKEGVRNKAWSSMVERQSIETEPRVFEAMKIAKVEAELGKKLTRDRVPVSKWTSQIASALTQALPHHVIPPDTTTKNPLRSRIEQCQSERITKIPAQSQPEEKHKKSTLRQATDLSNVCIKPRASYNTRRNLELRAIIEDQWKKQQLQEMEDEIKTKIEELEKDRDLELNYGCYKNTPGNTEKN